jgi:hypothetical protein
MKNTLKKYLSKTFLAIAALAFSISSCKKDETSSGTKKFALVIENGAQGLALGGSVTFSAVLVGTDGQIVVPSSVAWSSSVADAGSFTGSTFVSASAATTIVTATATYDGATYTASVPVGIHESASLFTVVPSAIVWSTNSGSIQLETVYFGTSSASYTFSSSNSGVASVDANGLVSFSGTGNCAITVNASIGGQSSQFVVPVLVVGDPGVDLPVSRIELTPGSGTMFRNETLQFSAKAFNSKNEDVSSSSSFEWSVVPAEDEEGNQEPIPVTVNSSGLVSSTGAVGHAYLRVKSMGVTASAEVAVYPDTIVMVSPFHADFGGFTVDPFTGQITQNPTSGSFTATTYKIDRIAFRNNAPNYLTNIGNLGGLKWELPLTGIPIIDQQLNIVTIANPNAATTTISSNGGASAGATFVMVYYPNQLTIEPGVVAITVMP